MHLTPTRTRVPNHLYENITSLRYIFKSIKKHKYTHANISFLISYTHKYYICFVYICSFTGGWRRIHLIYILMPNFKPYATLMKRNHVQFSLKTNGLVRICETSACALLYKDHAHLILSIYIYIVYRYKLYTQIVNQR